MLKKTIVYSIRSVSARSVRMPIVKNRQYILYTEFSESAKSFISRSHPARAPLHHRLAGPAPPFPAGESTSTRSRGPGGSTQLLLVRFRVLYFATFQKLRCLFCACFVLVLCNCLPGSHPSQGSDRSCISASLATAAVPVIFTPSSPFLPVKMITCGEPLILTLSNRTSTRYSPTAPAVNLMP